MLQPHGDVEPVEARRGRDTGIDQDRAQPGTAIGEGGNPGLLYLTNLGKAALDQRRDRGVGFGDRGKDLPGSTRCLDIAEPDFEMALALLTAPDEGRVQRQGDRRGGGCRLVRCGVRGCQRISRSQC
jgi:hypothetical protein